MIAKYLSRERNALGLAVLLVGVAAGVTTLNMWRFTPGRFTYTMDDAHIHLRVSQLLAEGTYGVNPGTPAAPSSSVIWPFLLAPFGKAPFLSVLPMVLNLVLLLALVVVVYRIVAKGWCRSPVGGRWRMPLTAALLTVVVVYAGGMMSAPFNGMEHVLHAFVFLLVVLGLVRAANDEARHLPWWFWCAAGVAPLVRYEGLAILAIGVVGGWVMGSRRAAIWTAAVSIGALLAFAGFLMILGLDPLPSSVLAKADGSAESSLLFRVRAPFVTLIGPPHRPSHAAVTLLLGGLMTLGLMVGLMVRKPRVNKAVVIVTAGAALTAAAQIVIVGPQTRYLHYIHTVVLCVGIGVWLPAMIGGLWRIPRSAQARGAAVALTAVAAVAVVVSLAGGASAQWTSAFQSVEWARTIHDQRYQMSRFLREELREPVGVNDLGHVVFDSRIRVVDLWGLGDELARERRLEGKPGWMSDVMRERGAEVAMVYPEWFESEIPEDWVPVGEFFNPNHGTPASKIVVVYATNDRAAQRVRAALGRFVPSDPERTFIRIYGE